ncbi:MAG: helix-turn-helix transcriptional regulator [Lachnospiraceae bacterium]|nr:helix-turn-helix transcriptional regulator [Lachnospiraceae bacterium]
MNTTTNNTPFNVLNRITELREAKGMSVYKLSKLSEIPQSTIATWYQKSLYPPIDKLERICNVLDISLANFFNVDGYYCISEENDLTLLKKWDLLTTEEKNSVMHIIDQFLANKHL